MLRCCDRSNVSTKSNAPKFLRVSATSSKRSILAVSIFISKHQLPHHGAFIFCHFGPSTSSITRLHVPIKHPLCYKFQSTGRLCFSIESRRYSLPLFHTNPFCNCISFLSPYPLPTAGWQHLSSFRLHPSLLDIVSILLSLGITLIWIRLLYLHVFNPYFDSLPCSLTPVLRFLPLVPIF